MIDHMIDATDANFSQQVLRQPRPAIAAFWASWNGPSAGQKEKLEALAQEFGPTVLIARVNVDDNPMTSSQYDLPSLPCYLLIHQSELVEIKAGFLPNAHMRELFEQAAELWEATNNMDTLA